MVNQSKANDPRFWKKWRDSESVEGILEAKARTTFNALRNHLGKEIKVDFVDSGLRQSEKGILNNIYGYTSIFVGYSGIPFVGYLSAIQRITNENGNVLYENPIISDRYSVCDSTVREELVARTFGEKIANEEREKRIRFDKEIESCFVNPAIFSINK